MSTIGASGKPQTRRYTPEEKAQAVRMVLALRKELGTSQGTVRRVADQLGYGVESVRGWVLCRRRHETQLRIVRPRSLLVLEMSKLDIATLRTVANGLRPT